MVGMGLNFSCCEVDSVEIMMEGLPLMLIGEMGGGRRRKSVEMGRSMVNQGCLGHHGAIRMASERS